MRSFRLQSSVWILYLLIIFEILFMISPLALYYYSAYGPLLNAFHSLPGINWLSGFFMPHFSQSELWFFNHLYPIGAGIFLCGLIVFVISAGQIYYAKFRKRGAVLVGLYRYIRHPQYSAFFIMGLGTLLVWPRFFILVTYISMVFLYFWLARKEEKDCLSRFGKSYEEYFQNTAMFFPGDSYILNWVNSIKLPFAARSIFGLSVYILTLTICVYLAFLIRDYALASLSIVTKEKSATISTVKMQESAMRNLLYVAYSDSQVVKILREANPGETLNMLNYIVPADWILPDLPLDDDLTSRRGHQQPVDYDRDRYKVLLTKSISSDDSAIAGLDIIKNTQRRKPLLVVYVDKRMGLVTKIKTAPETVLWGDIPTPLF